MKKIILKPIILCLLVIVAILPSCKKSNDKEPRSFTWTYNAVAYSANIKAAYLYSMSVGPIIIAGTGTSLVSGCITYGNDRVKAIDKASEAIELYLESLVEHAEEVPVNELL